MAICLIILGHGRTNGVECMRLHILLFLFDLKKKKSRLAFVFCKQPGGSVPDVFVLLVGGVRK